MTGLRPHSRTGVERSEDLRHPVRLGDPRSCGVLREEYREVTGHPDHKTHPVALRRTAAATGAAFQLQRIHAAHGRLFSWVVADFQAYPPARRLTLTDKTYQW